MTYLVLAALFVLAALLAGVILTFCISKKHARPSIPAILATLGVLIALTAIFDNIMIATGLFHYAPEQLVGVHIGLAPLEDFSYPIAGALLLPALWSLLRHRRATEDAR